MIEAGRRFLVADLWELNALGSAKPNLQRKFAIIGLGSPWQDSLGSVYHPALLEYNGLRLLFLGWRDSPRGWDEYHCRFAAVSK